MLVLWLLALCFANDFCFLPLFLFVLKTLPHQEHFLRCKDNRLFLTLGQYLS